jgi:hypothetical protein
MSSYSEYIRMDDKVKDVEASVKIEETAHEAAERGRAATDKSV